MKVVGLCVDGYQSWSEKTAETVRGSFQVTASVPLIFICFITRLFIF
jgi:hypothetical protein